MNILFYCDEYPPAQSGGIGTAVKIVAESLVQRGHKIIVVGVQQFNKTHPYKTIINGVIIYRLTHYRIVGLFKIFPEKQFNYALYFLKKIGLMNILAVNSLKRSYSFMNNIISNEKINIVEIPDYSYSSQYFHKVINFPKLETISVMRVHGCKSFISYYSKNIISDLDRKNDFNNYSSVDYICAVSKFSAIFLVSLLKISSNNISVIYNPIENSFFNKNITPQLGLKKNIVFLGKIKAAKGAFNLIKAFNQIANKYDDLTLTFLGKGEIETAKNLIDSNLANRIYFPGFLNRDQLQYEILNSLFCVIPSYFENFSLAALEVMSCKKALIYTKRASGPELITDGYDGLLVDPDNVHEISKAMMFLIENPKEREKMAELGYNNVKATFSENIIVSQLENYYQNIIYKSNDKEISIIHTT